MRLVESSDPFEVSREQARDLLHERLVLADGVAAALDRTEGQYVDRVASAGLQLLRSWVFSHYAAASGKPGTLWDGIDEMTVPAGSEDVFDRLRSATTVAACLATLYTADTQDEARGDSNDLSAALDRWRQRRPRDPTAWRRPVFNGPLLRIPRRGYEVSDELVFEYEAEAEASARWWNQALSDPAVPAP